MSKTYGEKNWTIGRVELDVQRNPNDWYAPDVILDMCAHIRELEAKGQ